MATIDDSDDLEIVILSELCSAAIRASTVLGPDGVTELHACPMEMVSLANPPALCVYRLREEAERISGTETLWDVVVQVDYVLPASSIQDGQRDARWKALKNAWHAIVDTLSAGHHADVRDDARVLDDMGIGIERDAYDLKMYTVQPESDAASFPFFRATFGFNYVETRARNTELVDRRAGEWPGPRTSYGRLIVTQWG
jgi:hypothetical protein